MMGCNQQAGVAGELRGNIDGTSPDGEVGLHRHRVKRPNAAAGVDRGILVMFRPSRIVQQHGGERLGTRSGTEEPPVAPVQRNLPGEPCVRNLGNEDDAGTGRVVENQHGSFYRGRLRAPRPHGKLTLL